MAKRGRKIKEKVEPVKQLFIQQEFYGERWKSEWHLHLSDMAKQGFRFIPPIFRMGKCEQMPTENGEHPTLYLITFEKINGQSAKKTQLDISTPVFTMGDTV